MRLAIIGADAIALETPWGPTRDALRAVGDVRGTVILDCANPVSDDLQRLVVDAGAALLSAARAHPRRLPMLMRSSTA